MSQLLFCTIMKRINSFYSQSGRNSFTNYIAKKLQQCSVAFAIYSMARLHFSNVASIDLGYCEITGRCVLLYNMPRPFFVTFRFNEKFLTHDIFGVLFRVTPLYSRWISMLEFTL